MIRKWETLQSIKDNKKITGLKKDKEMGKELNLQTATLGLIPSTFIKKRVSQMPVLSDATVLNTC